MKKFIYLSILIFLIPYFVYSQQKLNIDQAIQTALRNSTSIESLENDLQIQKYNTKSTIGNLIPSLGLSAGWSRSHTFSKGGTIYQNGIPIIVADQDDTQDNFDFNLNSSVLLFDGFANYKEVELENKNEQSLRLNLFREEKSMVISVTQSFFEVLKKKQIVYTNEGQLAESISQLEEMKELLDIGEKKILDIYKQEVQVGQNTLTLEKSKNQLKKAKYDLLDVMNEDLEKEFDIDSEGINLDLTMDDLELIIKSSSNIDKLVQVATYNRWDYKKALKDIEINQTKLSIAGRNLYLPKIVASASFRLKGDELSEISITRIASYGLTLSYPIFQGFDLDADKQKAEVNLKKKTEDLKILEHNIKLEIMKAVADLETAYKQIEVLETSIEFSKQDKELTEKNYQVGLSTMLELESADKKLNDLMLDKINAIYDFIIAKKLIDYYTGQLDY